MHRFPNESWTSDCIDLTLPEFQSPDETDYMTEQTHLPAPTVSVVMPVRNGGAFINDAVQSVVSQDFRDIELLIIDDGSTDFDYDQFATQDVRVRVIHLPQVGVSRARNTGIREAREIGRAHV